MDQNGEAIKRMIRLELNDDAELSEFSELISFDKSQDANQERLIHNQRGDLVKLSIDVKSNEDYKDCAERKDSARF